jgi:L-proline amide hydrolase
MDFVIAYEKIRRELKLVGKLKQQQELLKEGAALRLKPDPRLVAEYKKGLRRIEGIWKQVFDAQIRRLDTQGDFGNLANINLKADQAWIQFRDEKFEPSKWKIGEVHPIQPAILKIGQRSPKSMRAKQNKKQQWPPIRETRNSKGKKCYLVDLGLMNGEQFRKSYPTKMAAERFAGKQRAKREKLPVKEGYIPFRGHKVWYRIVGGFEERGKLPLLCLHGGPGIPHDYIESLEKMAATGRRVIFYDQLGCGNSDQPHDPSLWTVNLFVEEVDVVRKALGLKRIHLLGQSWGGMLAMQYALTQPAGLDGLIVASSPASMPQWVAEANRLRDALPKKVQQTLLKHEKAGTTGDPAYEKAMMVFYRRHVCRINPLPAGVKRAFAKLAQNPEVYNTMNGPSEFHVIGVFKDWNIIDRLGEIRVPTLVTSGRYDEATPTVAGTVHCGIIGSEWVVFEKSSHMAHVEEENRYMRVLARFLARIEERASMAGKKP